MRNFIVSLCSCIVGGLIGFSLARLRRINLSKRPKIDYTRISIFENPIRWEYRTLINNISEGYHLFQVYMTDNRGTPWLLDEIACCDDNSLSNLIAYMSILSSPDELQIYNKDGRVDVNNK